MNQSSPIRILLTERALQDLRNIESHSIERWGHQTAEKYMARIEAALNCIAERPELLREEPEFAESLKFYRVQKHILVCDIQSDAIYVLAVLHTSMDVPKRLAKLKPQLLLEVDLLHKKVAAKKRQ